MKLLSIDIGIKNMGVCLLEFKDMEKSKTMNKLEFVKIIDWKVINMLENHVKDSEIHNKQCDHIQKNKKKCINKANYYCDLKENDIHFFCKKHSKQTPFFITSKDYSKSTLQTKTIQQLLEFKKDKHIFLGYDNAVEDKITRNERIYKKELVDELHTYIKKRTLNPITKPTSHDISLVQTGIIIAKEFDSWLGNGNSNGNSNSNSNGNSIDLSNAVDVVVIENQISPIANRMKTIQGMVSQYFIMRNVTNIEFVSSSNKLSAGFQHQLNEFFCQGGHDDENKSIIVPTGKEHYKERKEAGLQIAYKLLQTINIHHHHDFTGFYESHKKKDDLADSLLQGVWFLLK